MNFPAFHKDEATLFKIGELYEIWNPWTNFSRGKDGDREQNNGEYDV